MLQPSKDVAEDAPLIPPHDKTERGPSHRIDDSTSPGPINRDTLVPFVASGLIAGLTQDLLSPSDKAPPAGESEVIEPPAKVPAQSGRSEMVQSSTAAPACSISWPLKRDVLGVEISVTSYDELCELFVAAAQRHEAVLASFLPVHGVVTAAMDSNYRHRINCFDVIAPDGQPVRWALNWLHKAQLSDRVSGPHMMLCICQRAAEQGVGIYLYGSTQDTLDNLRANLEQRFPQLRVLGVESPPFRPLSAEENDAVVDRINASGAGLVFIGLGLPRQDYFAYQNRNRINAVQLCVGAAFDFHAGKKKLAPLWMQKTGLEWTYRLLQEPRRLWKRYLVTNTMFVYLMTKRLVRGV
jgi:N-acetylglucosaminyldiphosphoundecaprenol N-acetyl-beta-D-mannosaminyltransferase